MPTWRAPFYDGLDEDEDDAFTDAEAEVTDVDADSAGDARFELVERWLVLDLEAAGLVYRWEHPRYRISSSTRIPPTSWMTRLASSSAPNVAA